MNDKKEGAGKYSEVYAVDFDKTINLAETYPELGKPNMPLIEFLIRRQQDGDKIILWTCREGDYLKTAIKYCQSFGLQFDAVNDNIKENIGKFKNNCRKVFADYYIDDKNLTAYGAGKLLITEELQEGRLLTAEGGKTCF